MNCCQNAGWLALGNIWGEVDKRIEKVYETTVYLSGGAVLIYRISLTLLQQVINYSVNVSFYIYSYCQRNLLYITTVYNQGIA